jgi:hypothetical protein
MHYDNVISSVITECLFTIFQCNSFIKNWYILLYYIEYIIETMSKAICHEYMKVVI